MTYRTQDEIGQRIKELRESAGMTRSTMAVRAGFAHSGADRIENGGGTTIYTLLKLCALLNVTPNDVLCKPTP